MLNYMTHFIKDNKRVFVYMLASTLILYFIFSPAINTLYYAHDDYRYAFGGLSKACKTDDGFEFMYTLGRPFQAYLDCMTYKFAYTLERMRVVRILSIVLMGCGMGLLIDWLCCLGFTLGTAFFSAGILFLLPEMYLDAVLTGAQPLPFSILLVFFSYFSRKKSPGLSAVLLLSSLLIYPAMAFFFVVMSLTKLLFSHLNKWVETRNEIIKEVVMFSVVCAIYAMWAFINMHYFPQAPVTDAAYQLDHPNLNLIEIFKRMTILGNMFNGIWAMSFLSNMKFQGCMMITLLFGGIIFGLWHFIKSDFYRSQKRIALIKLSYIVIFVCGLVMLSSSFVLIMPSRVFEARLMIGLIAAGMALLLWSLTQWNKVLPKLFGRVFIPTFVCLVFLVEGYHTNISMTAFAYGFNQYFNFSKSIISHKLDDNQPLHRIHYIVSKATYPYDKFFLTNVALLSKLGRDNYKLQWCSLSRGTPGEEKDHQDEMIACVNKLPSNGIAVTYTYPGEPYTKTNGMLVIDMQDVTPTNYAKRYFKDYFDIDASPNIG